VNLSKNFTLAELSKSQIAIMSGLTNNPSEQQIENLRLLCEEFYTRFEITSASG